MTNWEPYLAERKAIYDCLLAAIAVEETRSSELAATVPRWGEISGACYGDKPIPEHVDVKEIFRFFCTEWKPNKL